MARSGEAGRRRAIGGGHPVRMDAAPAGPSALATEEIVPVVARVMRLQAGLSVVEIGVDKPSSAPVRVGQLPSAAEGIDLLAAGGGGEQWLPDEDNLIVVRAPQAGALLLATAFGSSGRSPSAPRAAVRSLESQIPAFHQPPDAATLPAEQPSARGHREIRVEVTVHLEGVGDRVFPGATWAGPPGERKRVEGFAIKPLQELRANEIEYKVLHPGGVETPWIAGPLFCGTRGRGLPIVGFAVRVAPHVQDQFAVVYQGAFFRGGVTESRGNGAPCLPAIAGDALEGINIRVLQGQPG